MRVAVARRPVPYSIHQPVVRPFGSTVPPTVAAGGPIGARRRRSRTSGRPTRGERRVRRRCVGAVCAVRGDDAVVVGDAGLESPRQLGLAHVDGARMHVAGVPRALRAGAAGGGRPVLDRTRSCSRRRDRHVPLTIALRAPTRGRRVPSSPPARPRWRGTAAARAASDGGDDGESTAHCRAESPPVALGAVVGQRR